MNLYEINMSNSKWVAASVVGVAALGGAAAMTYFMLKEDEDFRARTIGQPHVSSRPITLEVRIPQNHAGLVIGNPLQILH